MIAVKECSIFPQWLNKLEKAYLKLGKGPADEDNVEAAAGQLGWKLVSCSHGQELGQLADLASDCLFTLVHPIRSQPALTLDNDYNS